MGWSSKASETILPFGSRAACPGPEPSLDIPPLASEGSEAVGLRGLPHPRRFMFQLPATPSCRTLRAPQKAPLALRDRASWGHVIERGLGDPLPRPPLRLVPLEAGPLTAEPASHPQASLGPQGLQEAGAVGVLSGAHPRWLRHQPHLHLGGPPGPQHLPTFRPAPAPRQRPAAA